MNDSIVTAKPVTAVTPLDVAAIRKDFPILKRLINGKRLVYLDSAATTQKPRQVIDAISHFYENTNSNIHRGVYTLADEATTAYEGARERVAKFINAPSSKGVVFTRGTTESINLVAQAWARPLLKEGDEILVTDMEHHSNLVPWYQVCKQTGASLRSIPLGKDFTLDLSNLENLLTEKTKILAVGHVSNVLGAINPVKDLVEKAHKVGALVLVDGAQAAPHMAIDMQDLGADFYAFSSHKMLGPTGVGVLYAKPDLLKSMEPWQGGGEMIRLVRLNKITWNDIPMRFEAGTPNIADTVALTSAIDYLENLGLANIKAHERKLTAYLLERLEEFPGIHNQGPADLDYRAGVVSFTSDSVHPHDLATILDQHGVAVRAGHHCAQPLMRTMEVQATTRASFHCYNDTDDIDALMEGMHAARKYFG